MTIRELWGWLESAGARLDLALAWEEICRDHPASHGRRMPMQRQVELLVARVVEEVHAVTEDGPNSAKWALIWSLSDPTFSWTVTRILEGWCPEQDPELPVRRLVGATAIVLDAIRGELEDAIGRRASGGRRRS